MGIHKKRAVEVWLYPPEAGLNTILAGGATPVDLGPFLNQARQSAVDAQLTLSGFGRLPGGMPRAGQWVEFREGDELIWRGFIAEITEFRLSRGEQRLRLNVRSRSAMPFWRQVKRLTDVFSAGTAYEAIATAIAETLNLTESEYSLGGIGLTVVQQNVQLADLTAWEMLEALLLPAGLEPWVNRHGVLTHLSRDTTRPPTRVLNADEVLAITGSRAELPVTRVRLRWLDPHMSRFEQQDQLLATATLTAGFFQLRQEQTLRWSVDGRQRASNTYLVVRQTCNSGLIPVAEERYIILDDYSGKIRLDTQVWVPTLATASLAGILAAAAIPDKVVFLATIPIGRIIQAGLEVALLLIMMSIGTGVYEVWGQPYDYVHAVNTTEAYLCDTPLWLEELVDIENDLVTDEAHAQAITQRELRYRAQEADRYGVDIVDDFEIDRGDILQLPTGEKLYVTGYTRDLSRGASAVLSIEGFRVR